MVPGDTQHQNRDRTTSVSTMLVDALIPTPVTLVHPSVTNKQSGNRQALRQTSFDLIRLGSKQRNFLNNPVPFTLLLSWAEATHAPQHPHDL